MKKLFEEDDEYTNMEKSKILVTLIPVVLILLILAVMLVVNKVKGGEEEPDNLQQSIMDYADENRDSQRADSVEPSTAPVFSSSVSGSGEQEQDNEDSQKEEEEDTEEEEALPSPTPYQDIMEAGKKDYSKIAFHEKEQLRDMLAYWADSNQKAVEDLVHLDHYLAMSWSLKGTTDFYYYGDVNGSGAPNGKGVAVYADNQYYYGDWKDGVRSGNGTWIHYHIHQSPNTTDLYTYHQYTGGWANDLPEGEGSEHYDYEMSLLKENQGYNANLIGSYLAGYIHGEFYITNIYEDESSKEWSAEADHGSWLYQNRTKDKKGNRAVQVDLHDPDNYVWMHPRNNVNIRGPCLISNNWKK